MESVRELKVICKPKIPPTNLISRIYYRPVSYYLTWVLLKLNLSANQVSVLGLLIGLFAGLLMLSPKTILFSGFFVLLSLTCDACDGEVARYRLYKKLPTEHFRKFGGFFDWLANIVIPFSMLMLGLYFSIQFSSALFLFMGILLCIFVFLNKGGLSLLSSIVSFPGETKKRIRHPIVANLRGYYSRVFPFLLITFTILSYIFPLSLFFFWLFYGLFGVFLLLWRFF